MAVSTISDIIREFNTKLDIDLKKIPRKKIIYIGQSSNNQSVAVILPKSKIYYRGNGWVDLTEVQINLMKQYKFSIAVFRLANGINYYVNLGKLFPLLLDKSRMFNSHEGYHWKMDIWPEKLAIRGSNKFLPIQSNNKDILFDLFNN